MRLFHTIIFYAIIAIFFLHFDVYSQSNESKIKNLSEGADIILTGKVVKQTSAWNKDMSRIFTHVVIQADEYLKGDYSEKSIAITTLGGEVGEVGELYSHMPRFSKEEEVLLFIKKDKKDMKYKVFNGEDGKISVIIDPRTGEKVTPSNVQINSLKTQIKSYINN